MGLLIGSDRMLWSVVLGVGLSLVPPAIFTLAGEVVPPAKLGTGYGILNTLFNAGVFVPIPFIGKIRDVTGDYRASFALMAALLTLGSLLAAISGKIVSGQQNN